MGAPIHRWPESALRSFLFSPGIDSRKLAKAAASEADAVIFDLEDAVADSRKAEARTLVADETRRYGASRPVQVRVNAVPTGLIAADLDAICMPQLAGVWLPKAENVDEVKYVDDLLTKLEAERAMAPGSVHLLLSFETARGAHFAYDLASACDRVTAVSAGTAEGGDLHAEMGGLWSDDVGTVPYVRSRVVLAARAAGIDCIVDGACTRLDDAIVARSAEAAREAGYTGKMAIHPRHIAPIHDAFAPTAAELDHATEVVKAFAAAEAEGIAAISVGGRMIDYAMVVNARRVLNEADARNLREKKND
jgi:citrate lyase subunit beta / citryl-CoA lyase